MLRWVRSAAAATVMLATIVACTHATKHPGAQASQPAPTNPPTMSTPTATPPDRSTEVAFGPLQLHLPAGWERSDYEPFTTLCVQPIGHPAAVFGCGGLAVSWGWNGYLPGNEMTTFTRSHPGWYHATDVQPCPVDPTKGPNNLNGIRDDGLVGHESLRPVGGRTAYFYQWQAHCDSGYKFSPRAWYLPASKVLIFDYVGNSAADALLRTATFDTGHWTFGFLRGATRTGAGVRLNFDEAVWLSGDAANYYARHHGMESPVPNDYLIVNPDTSTRSVPLSATATVTSVFQLAGTEPGKDRVVSIGKLVAFVSDHAHWEVPFHVHLDASGHVDQVFEQYRP